MKCVRKEDENQDKDGAGAGTRMRGAWILELMPISFLDKPKGMACTALYLLLDSKNE
jgi:hypothetical protein